MSDEQKGELARYEAMMRRQELHWRANFDRVLHSDRAAVDIGIGAVKTVILINGGAIAGLLAFAAQVWKDVRPTGPQAMTAGLPFVIGVATGAIAFGLAYICQSALVRRHVRDLETISTSSELLPSIRWINRTEVFCKAAMILLTVTSTLAFVYGAVSVAKLFQHLV